MEDNFEFNAVDEKNNKIDDFPNYSGIATI